jgi:hypothetical protein
MTARLRQFLAAPKQLISSSRDLLRPAELRSLYEDEPV